MTHSPRQFMEQRRPEKFSDSIIIKQSKLNRTLLEYHLDTLTSRNQDRTFETFAIKLAQFEICPSLRMQTGPVGGGDSKADSENIPVSQLTALSFWDGIANDNNDRWAFAVSAKKDWVAKVKHDVESIASTKRDYAKIYFITNQFAKDKKRAELEDDLSKVYGVDVIILDRTWILDRIFKNNRQKLAIEALYLEEGLEEEIELGLLDIDRLRRFKSVNIQIEEAVSKRQVTYPVIDLALESALLARGMGKSRVELDGLFERALRLAKQFGSSEHIYTIKYQKAWTVYFWFEDIEEFLSLYEQLEVLAKDTSNIYTIERQNNLWQLLWTLSLSDYPLEADLINQKTNTLKILLTGAATDDAKPNSSLQAKAFLVLDDLMMSVSQQKNIDKPFSDLAEILSQSERLIGFSYESIITIIQELGNEFSGNEKYEALIETLIKIDTKRKGELPSGRALLKFGLQHFLAGKIYKAIEYIAKSLVDLFKEESKDEFVKALFYLGIAYEKAGLLWAARGAFLNAASFATSDFWLHQNINTMQSRCYEKLKLIELQLGRIGSALEWHELDRVTKNHLAHTDEERGEFIQKTCLEFGAVLGCLLIKTPQEFLNKLEKLPDTLIDQDLDFGAFGLMYLLGGEKYLPKEFIQGAAIEDSKSFFQKWLIQPAQRQLPDKPNFYLEDEIQLKSKVLGMLFTLYAKNDSPALEIAESLLAQIEGFLSTAIELDAIGKWSLVKITLINDESKEKYLHLEPSKDYSDEFVITYKKFDPHVIPIHEHHKISECMYDILIYLIASTVIFKNIEKDMIELLDKQNASSRTFNFSSSFVSLGNVLGYTPKRSIGSWINQSAKSYPFVPDTSRILYPREAIREIPKEEYEIEEKHFISHTDMRTINVIDDHEWRKASWRGVAFIVDPNPVPFHPLTLLFMFDNEESAKKIFNQWKRSFGENVEKHVRISILKGVNKNEPYWYNVLVTPQLLPEQVTENHRLYFMAKSSTMTPSKGFNLDGFLKSYEQMKHCIVAPSFYDSKKNRPIPFFELSFSLSNLIVKNAWEIGVTDIDSAGIKLDFDPLIPEEVKEAPVLELLKIKQQKRPC